MLTLEDRQRLLAGQAAWFGRMGHPVAQKASLDALARITRPPAAGRIRRQRLAASATPRTKADFIERDQRWAEVTALVRKHAPARCLDGTVDYNGDCFRCSAAAGEICRKEA